MSLRALPLTVLAFILYNFIVFTFAGSGAAVDAATGVPAAVTDAASDALAVLRTEIFSLPMMSNVRWSFSWGDLILLITLLVLFIEIVKSTYTTTASMIDHGLSMLVFIACLIEFLLVGKAATSIFFLIMVAALVDVVAGYTIGIRVARRDLNFGGGDH